MRLLSIIALFTISLCVHGQSEQTTKKQEQSQEIRGIVMNLLGRPLKGSVISVSGQEQNLLSGETGEFSFKILESNESTLGFVAIRHPEYAELRIPLQEFRGTTGRLSVMLDARGRNCRHVIQ